METMKAPKAPSGTETNKNLWGLEGPLTSSKSEVIGSFIGMGIVGFWFGIGLMGSHSYPRPHRGPC